MENDVQPSGSSNFEPRGGVVAIGNFDGVHRGHQQIFQELVRQARAAQVPAVALTFDPPPVAILAPDKAPPLLTTSDDKVRLIRACGVDAVIVYPTDRALLELGPAEFFQTIILGRLHAYGLVEGANFCFGRGRSGTVETLKELCRAADRTMTVVDYVTRSDTAGQTISSSAIRDAIRRGDLVTATAMLGRPYHLTGTVVPGASRGRTLGFPTANLDEIRTMLPPEGVYGGRCEVDGRKYAAAVNLGPNPTFGELARKVEVHLLDFTGDLYGQTLSLDWLTRVRATQKFHSVTELREQLARDIAAVRKFVGVTA